MAVIEIGGVSLFTAFFAGMLSFLSPCVLPLVPGYLSAVTGVAAADMEEVGWKRVIPPSLLFIAAFSTIFIILGMSATGLSQLLRENLGTLNKIAGVLIIAMGVFFVASLFITRLNSEWRVDALMEKAGSGGPIVAGAAFAIAWTPCVGPTLTAILALAGTTGSITQGGFTLAIYSLGLAVPFLLTAIAFTRMTTAFDLVKRHYAALMAVGGVFLIVMGVLVYTNEITQFNIWAQDLVDSLGLDFLNGI
jgi:cytochrome c-type biogenesis protein